MRRKYQTSERSIDSILEKTNFNERKLLTNTAPEADSHDQIFDNLPEYISPGEITLILPIARATVYDWVYRPKKYDVPAGLIVKFGRKIFIRTTELKKWLISRGANQRTIA